MDSPLPTVGLAARYPENVRGKCASCGFLAKYRDGQWWEASIEDRAAGNLSQGGAPHYSIPNCAPNCFVWANDVFFEYGTALGEAEHEGDPAHRTREQATLHVIQRDRHCESWFPFQNGMAPQDHYRELRMLELEQERETLQVRLAEMDRRADQRADRLARLSLVSAGILGLAGIVIAVIAVVATLYPDGARALLEGLSHASNR